MPTLDQITLKGFKSINDLTDFKLDKLNILIGANGAGKSNLVDFFRLLRSMADGAFQKFVANSGGPDGFFFNGPKETTQITAHLNFSELEFRLALQATVAGEMIFADEATLFRKGGFRGRWRSWGSGQKESALRTWQDKSPLGYFDPGEAHFYEAISNWTVYHFHDTSSTAPMRRDGPVRDFRELRPDAGNIAAFLLKMRDAHNTRYQRIRETIQLIAPYFDDFLLEPQRKGDNELVRLEWRQKGSRFPLQPWQFSDGTIRFICLATTLLQPTAPSTVVIDEPELGLHPVAIELLAALLSEAADQIQVLVSTQSPLLINHFEPEEAIVVDRVGGASRFRRLESESLHEWLVEYSLGELVQKNVIEAGPQHA